jgi:hypothetical protein
MKSQHHNISCSVNEIVRTLSPSTYKYEYKKYINCIFNYTYVSYNNWMMPMPIELSISTSTKNASNVFTNTIHGFYQGRIIFKNLMVLSYKKVVDRVKPELPLKINMLEPFNPNDNITVITKEGMGTKKYGIYLNSEEVSCIALAALEHHKDIYPYVQNQTSFFNHSLAQDYVAYQLGQYCYHDFVNDMNYNFNKEMNDFSIQVDDFVSNKVDKEHAHNKRRQTSSKISRLLTLGKEIEKENNDRTNAQNLLKIAYSTDYDGDWFE